MRARPSRTQDRCRRLHPGQRLQPCRHADDAAERRRSAALSGDRADWRLGSDGPRRNRRRHPIFAQLAKSLADSGFIVLRYDKRGIGQSGGRTDSATLNDYADDAMAAVSWLSQRKDVDERRIVVVGHGEGGAVALVAASREKKIDGIVTLGARIEGRRSGAQAAASRARSDEAVGGRQAGQDRAAEENPGGRGQRKRLGGHSDEFASRPTYRGSGVFSPTIRRSVAAPSSRCSSSRAISIRGSARRGR